MANHSQKEYPWLRSYDTCVVHTIQIPHTGLPAILDQVAHDFGSRCAIEFQNTKISYQQLKDLSERFAASLRSHGVNPGDRISIMLPNLPQTYIAFWGALKAGAIVVMTNPRALY